MRIVHVFTLLFSLFAAPGGAGEVASPITDGSAALGTRLYATTQAYGTFKFLISGQEQTIVCEGIPGISGVETLSHLDHTNDGRPVAHLRRLITHFHQDVEGLPLIIIEQNLEGAALLEQQRRSLFSTRYVSERGSN